jgi:hypothetical protein
MVVMQQKIRSFKVKTLEACCHCANPTKNPHHCLSASLTTTLHHCPIPYPIASLLMTLRHCPIMILTMLLHLFRLAVLAAL